MISRTVGAVNFGPFRARGALKTPAACNRMLVTGKGVPVMSLEPGARRLFASPEFGWPVAVPPEAV